MVNMSNDTEVSNVFHFGNFFAGGKYTALVVGIFKNYKNHLIFLYLNLHITKSYTS